MDAAWKVYVGDRRFDDNQISNLFLKLKYETVGRFTFDFRPIDGDESYMVVGNTLRIFWGDLHRLDGVIQRVDWDDTLYCYHVFGADIRGFLLDRVNTEPSTVSSYTSDVQTSLMYEGCDFPSNIWTGAGDKIGTYTFHYKLGIQNTIRITGATQNIWHFYTERGTVYDHVNGCLYDATKNWATNAFAGATLRFVSGACKNNVYNINGNTTNRVCIRLPGEPASLYGNSDKYVTFGTETFYNFVDNGKFETDFASWVFSPAIRGTTVAAGATCTIVTGGYDDSNCIYINSGNRTSSFYTNTTFTQTTTEAASGDTKFTFRYKQYRNYTEGAYSQFSIRIGDDVYSYTTDTLLWSGNTNPSWPAFDVATVNFYGSFASGTALEFLFYTYPALGRYIEFWLDDVSLIETDNPTTAGADGTIPGCSRLGDIYEIVFASTERIDPATLAPATLVKDEHIVNFNLVEDMSDRVTSVVVQGINTLANAVETYTEGWHWRW